MIVPAGFPEQLEQMNAELAQRVFHECSNCGMVNECPPRQQLEHSLAVNFVQLQDERNPEKRQALWFECLRLGRRMEEAEW